MAGRQSYQNKIFHNEPGLYLLFFKVTAAADVDADGYTINEGSDVVSTFAKAAEGTATITLHKKFKRVLGIEMATSRADSNLFLVSEDVDGAKTISIRFEEAATDTDPDSAVMYFKVWLKRSNVD